jgi:type 1 glutamine amidotransferase
MLLRAIMLSILAAAFFAPRAQAEDDPPAKKVVLIAGPITGHPKHTHEYEKSVILLKHVLDTSPNAPGVTVETHFRGWPDNPATLDDADTIVLISDGSDRREGDHPLYVGERLSVLERQMRRGCGLVLLHWSTFNPSRFHDRVTEWVGGYFDYETGPEPRKWRSAIQTWEGPTKLGAAGHPILRGVAPPRVQEEFYYRIRFREDDPRVTPVLLTRPPGETQDYAVGWAVEREDSGRGFGFTGGHFYRNWWNDDFRRLILNAIVWTAGADVLAGGVASELAEPKKALIVTGYQHPAHDWSAVTEALIQVLEQDPRMFVDVTENPEDLASEKIRDYDLLVMNYNNWDRPGLSDAAKNSFVAYLKKGGALALIHFANGAFNETLPSKDSEWPEYRTRIVRRAWMHDRSGHDKFGPFRVDITSVEHPITAGLAPFQTLDELYYRQEGDQPIEPLATAVSQVTGRAEPMAWAYNYGQGRVFQTVLGHSDQSIRLAGALIRRGCMWAAGAEPLSFDPPAELTADYLWREGASWRPRER